MNDESRQASSTAGLSLYDLTRQLLDSTQEATRQTEAALAMSRQRLAQSKEAAARRVDRADVQPPAPTEDGQPLPAPPQP